MRRTTLVILIVLLSSAITLMAGIQKHVNHNVLGIEFIGPKDHLIGPIVISDSKKGADWFSKTILKKTIAWDYTPEFVVNASVMKSLIAEAEVHRSIVQHEMSNIPEIDQTVRITLVTPQGQSNYLMGEKLASSMLESFKVLCKENRPLQSEITGFQNEIRP